MKSIILKLTLVVILFFSFINMKNSETDNIKKKVNQFTEVKLITDLSVLDPEEKKILPYLFKVADIMDSLFWIQAFGDKNLLLNKNYDTYTKEFIKLNYGPWERLNGNKPFVPGYGEKPAGANFYPDDITKNEFEELNDTSKLSYYTMIRRDKKGTLVVIPYHIFFKDALKRASDLLLNASKMAKDKGLKEYLKLRAYALITDEYFESDTAWMNMKTNQIDFVVGPIENYEDELYGSKTSFEAYILIKDMVWSKRLDKYTSLLSRLQNDLPVESKYKQESPGSNSELAAYDVVYYAGDCNAGAKTIAINLPNDERVHVTKGTRRLQLKNTMKAKFDSILIPISKLLISENQIKNVTFDAFFENVMFHEVAHGLGIKETINGKGTVREALKEQYSAIEEGKADILGLYMVTKLNEWSELNNDLTSNYVTFMAGIFRSIRFGASSAHGKANLLRYNFFKEKGAFTRYKNGTYEINTGKMKKAMEELSELIITIQGNGDYNEAIRIMNQYGNISDELKADLDKINKSDIPIDIRFIQGIEILGLNN